jgi:hypothetical protein
MLWKRTDTQTANAKDVFSVILTACEIIGENFSSVQSITRANVPHLLTYVCVLLPGKY